MGGFFTDFDIGLYNNGSCMSDEAFVPYLTELTVFRIANRTQIIVNLNLVDKSLGLGLDCVEVKLLVNRLYIFINNMKT